MLFDFFKKKPAQKAVKPVRNYARYRIVSGTDEWQREMGVPEFKPEDWVLNQYGRGKMLDLARNAARNSSTLASILKQLDVNVIGAKGGKCITDDEAIKEEFSKWTREADFFDGLSFNSVLKLILKTQVLGGDVVLLFDDGLIEDSGKILIYEPDEIGNSTEEAIAQHYGNRAHQSLGRVYNQNGRFIGAVVSRSQRGMDVFDPMKSFFLHRDPDASFFDSKWLMPRNIYRVQQGRGIAPLAQSLATILDLEDLCSFELAASKKNAQTIAQVLMDKEEEEQVQPSPFEDGVDFSQMTDEEIEQYAKDMQAEKTISLDRVRSAGIEYQVMPEGVKIDMLDTKHPNSQIAEFISYMAGRAAAPFGLSRAYATMSADGDSFRAQQLMAWPAVIEAQKQLEQICDWTLARWSIWAKKKGLISNAMPSHVDWDWPRMQDVDENAHADAADKKLKNMTGSYKDEFGPDWKQKLEQIKNEIQWCKENHLPHPSYSMVSGGERSGADDASMAEQSDKE